MTKLAKAIEYLFYLFIFLLPWQTRWIWHYGKLGGEVSQYLTFSLYGTEILLYVILALAIIYLYKSPVKEKAPDKNFLVYAAFGLLAALMIIFSLFWAGDKMAVAYYAVKILEGLALLLLVINFPPKADQPLADRFSFSNTAGALVLSGLVQSILAICQFFSQSVWASKWLGMAEQLPQTLGVSVIETNGQRLLRAYGSLPHPNILAGFLVVCFLLLVVLLILARHKWEKIFLWCSAPIILAGLFFTFSKSAFAALGVGLVFLFTYIFLKSDEQVKKTAMRLIIVLLLTASCLLVVFKSPVLTRLNNASRLEQKSTAERALYLGQAMDLIKTNWFFGTGLGNFTPAVFSRDAVKQPAWYYQPVHNVYLLVWTELGLAGFFIFLFFIFLILKQARKIFQSGSLESAGLSAVILALLAIMLFDHYLWTMYFGVILWWLCLGLWLKARINANYN